MMWKSLPIDNHVYVALRVPNTSDFEWWLVPLDTRKREVPVTASVVPELIRRRAYRAMWTNRNQDLAA
jgi:hypothetical protein